MQRCLFFLLLLTAPKITEQCGADLEPPCIPASEVQARCQAASDDALPQFYPAEPDKCFLYAHYGTTDSSTQTVAFAINKCNEWGSAYSFSCILASPQNTTEMTQYIDNSIYIQSMICWAGCYQPTGSTEPAGGWMWAAAYPPGSSYPASTLPWQKTTAKNYNNNNVPPQPDNKSGSESQCAWEGGKLTGLTDENPTTFAPQINSVQCECIVLPSTTSTTTTSTTTPKTTTSTTTPTTTSTTSTTTTTTTPTTTSTTSTTTTKPTTTSTTTTTPITTTTTTPTTTSTTPTTTTTITPTTTSTTTTTTPTTTTTTTPTTTSTTSTTTTTTKKPTTTSTTSTTTTTTKKPTTTSTTTTTTKMPTTTTATPVPSPCSIMGVDPDVHLSSTPKNYKVYPRVTDCAAQCAAEANFTCRAFVWMGPSSGCVLHGKIDMPVIMENGSQWFLVDLDCAAKACYWPIQRTNIDPSTIGAPMTTVNVQNHNQCQALCLLGRLQLLCRAYALSTDPFYANGYNCYLFPALSPGQTSAAASGKFTLYQNECASSNVTVTTTTKKPTTTTKKPTTTSTTTTTKKPTTTTTTTKKPTTTTTTTKKPTTTSSPLPSACTIMGVDPNVHLCSTPKKYKVYENVTDCAAKCAAETNFTCKGFVWKGAGSGCVLHGPINKPVVMQNGSKWFLVDLDCKAQSPCYWPIKAVNIAPTTIAAPMKAVKVQNHNHCQALCLLGILQPKCWAYALNTASAVTTGNNCYLFSQLTTSQTSAAASGKFTLYQNQCPCPNC